MYVSQQLLASAPMQEEKQQQQQRSCRPSCDAIVSPMHETSVQGGRDQWNIVFPTQWWGLLFPASPRSNDMLQVLNYPWGVRKNPPIWVKYNCSQTTVWHLAFLRCCVTDRSAWKNHCAAAITWWTLRAAAFAGRGGPAAAPVAVEVPNRSCMCMHYELKRRLKQVKEEYKRNEEKKLQHNSRDWW